MQAIETAPPVTLETLEAKRLEIREFEEAISFHFGQSTHRPAVAEGSPLQKLESLIAQTKSREQHAALAEDARKALEESRRELADLEHKFKAQRLQPEYEAAVAELQTLAAEANQHMKDAIAVYKKIDEIWQTKMEALQFGNFRFSFWHSPTETLPVVSVTPHEIFSQRIDALNASDRRAYLQAQSLDT